MSEEMAALARGLVEGLQSWAPLMPAMSAMADAPFKQEVLADLRKLCERAVLVSAESSDAEFQSIFEQFLDWTARYGLLPSNGKGN